MKRSLFFPLFLLLLFFAEAPSRNIDLSPLADLSNPDSLHQVSAWSEAPADTLTSPAADPLLVEPPERPHYVIRNFDHKEQVITGSIIMSCIALMMVTMNNYNPR